jgi:hypothetical protein
LSAEKADLADELAREKRPCQEKARRVYRLRRSNKANQAVEVVRA